MPAPSPVPSGSRCLLAAMPDERHTLGLEMLGAALEDDGWSVQTALGHACDDLAQRVWRERPSFVGLSAGFLQSSVPLAALIAGVRRQGVPVIVGGQAFGRTPDLCRRLGATSRAPDLRVGLVLARRTVVRGRAGAA
jgi:hypothetical protein